MFIGRNRYSEIRQMLARLPQFPEFLGSLDPGFEKIEPEPRALYQRQIQRKRTLDEPEHAKYQD